MLDIILQTKELLFEHDTSFSNKEEPSIQGGGSSIKTAVSANTAFLACGDKENITINSGLGTENILNSPLGRAIKIHINNFSDVVKSVA